MEDIHDRIKEVSDPLNYVFWRAKNKEEENKKIKEGIDELYHVYLRFKSHVHVRMPEYPSILKAIRVGEQNSGKGLLNDERVKGYGKGKGKLLKYMNKETVRIDKVNN